MTPDGWLLAESVSAAALSITAWSLLVHLRDAKGPMGLRLALCLLMVLPAIRAAALACAAFDLPNIGAEWVKTSRAVAPALCALALVHALKWRPRCRVAPGPR